MVANKTDWNVLRNRNQILLVCFVCGQLFFFDRPVWETRFCESGDHDEDDHEDVKTGEDVIESETKKKNFLSKQIFKKIWPNWKRENV